VILTGMVVRYSTLPSNRSTVWSNTERPRGRARIGRIAAKPSVAPMSGRIRANSPPSTTTSGSNTFTRPAMPIASHDRLYPWSPCAMTRVLPAVAHRHDGMVLSP